MSTPLIVHWPAGKSLLPLVRGSHEPVHTTPVFWEHEGNRAMRDGQWKLVWARKEPWELFDLSTDRTEMHNLFDELTGRAADIQRTWEFWARHTGVQFPTSFSYYNMIRDSQNSRGKKQNPDD